MGRRAMLLQEMHGGVQETHGNRGTACLRKRCELDGVDELPAGKLHGIRDEIHGGRPCAQAGREGLLQLAADVAQSGRSVCSDRLDQRRQQLDLGLGRQPLRGPLAVQSRQAVGHHAVVVQQVVRDGRSRVAMDHETCGNA